MSLGPNYYSVLGVAVDSEDVVIRAAYRALMQKYHPDRWPDSTAVSESRAREINEAYAVLSDPEARSSYDASLNRQVAGGIEHSSEPGGAGEIREQQIAPPARKKMSQLSRLLGIAASICGLAIVIVIAGTRGNRDRFEPSTLLAVAAPVTRVAFRTNGVPPPPRAQPVRQEVTPSPPHAQPVLHEAAPSPPQSGAAATQAAAMIGMWKLEAASDCSASYRLAVSGNYSLTLTGPDGTEQREAILGMDGEWLRTAAGSNSSFYRMDGSSLRYRYGSRRNRRSETRFERCG